MNRDFLSRVRPWFLSFVAGVSLAALGGCGGGSDSTGSTAQRRVSVMVASPLAAGESFQFSLGTQGVTVTQSNVAVAFASTLAEGAAYTVNQTAGPRACSLSANRTGSIGAADVIVTATCGSPPAQRRVSVLVDTPVAAGETFQFSLGAQSISITQSNTATAFAATLAEGTSYTVNQTSGPRACNLSANRTGTIGAADVLVSASCGNPAGQSALQGELRAPVGTATTLRNNGGDDLAVAVPASTDLYGAQSFSFAAPLADGSAYSVSIFAKPANQTCSVYKGGSGTMPVASGALKVGCEVTYDHVSRRSNNVLATRVEAFVPAIGGANAAVGSTATAYGEGRFVAFVSSATGLSPNGFRQVFWRDRWTGETLLISADASGNAGNGQSDHPAISADGLTVVFESLATNLVAGDTNGASDVFVWSAGAGVLPAGVQRVSVGTGGAQADGPSRTPTVSGDGHIVAFSTNASNLTAGVSGTSTTNVVRRDLPAGVNVLVSRNAAGNGVGGDQPTLSEDGNRLAYWSFASQIVTGDTNGLWDIFVYQHDTSSQRRVSLRSDGGERNQGSDSTSRIVAPAISGDGRFVAFSTTSTNVVAGDTNNEQDIFVVDLDGALGVRRASLGPAAVQGNGSSPALQGERVALSYDGSWMAFTSTSSNFGTASSGTNVFLRNLGTGEIRALTDATFGADIPTMSRSAAYVVFGAASQLDSRFASTGLFAHFTNLARAWWWID